MGSGYLFEQAPTIQFLPETKQCPQCGQALQVLKTETRNVVTLHIGKFIAHHTIYKCPLCKPSAHYPSMELNSIIPKHSNFGYDVLVHVGKAVFGRHLTAAEAMGELSACNISISPSEVNYLAQRFVVYLAIAHRNIASQISETFKINGGYILHIDSTMEGSSPHLMSGLDELSKFVLSNEKMPTEHSMHVTPFLENIKQKYGNPLSLVSDMGRAMLSSAAEVFPGTPLYICHFHFLRDIGKDMLEKYYAHIRDTLKKHGISTKLRYRLRQYSKDNYDKLETNLDEMVQEIANQQLEENHVCSLCYTLSVWALDGKNKGSGFGFPFDRPHYEFYKRMEQVAKVLEYYLQGGRFALSHKARKTLEALYGDSSPLISDTTCKENVAILEQKMGAFDNLRAVMKIALPGSKNGINDSGQEVDMKSIEKQLEIFRAQLFNSPEYGADIDYQKMTAQIDKYWDKLFAPQIIIETPNGIKTIQPQRTNNIMEQFFRDLKKSHRRTTGNNSIAKRLETMIADTPLIKNLENKEYMKILLGEKVSLEDVFAQIEHDSFKEEMKKNKVTQGKIPPKINQLIKKQNVPEYFLALGNIS
jgi:hypothetical protein